MRVGKPPDRERRPMAPAKVSSVRKRCSMTAPAISKDRKPEAIVREVIASIPLLRQEWYERATERLNSLTKPLGSLGRLEDIAARIVAIREELRPDCSKKVIFTFAADHGVTEEGVSAYPKAVTRQMLLNFLAGGAAINVLCRHFGIDVAVVDIGVDGDTGELRGLVRKKIAPGTRNMASGPAMTADEMFGALQVLQRVGGLEIAGLTGLVLGGAARRIPIVGDGFISTAAAAIACALQPRVRHFLFAAHRSSEPGHDALLKFIGQEPLLDLHMRLGEGTGAALGMSLVESATKLLNEMATFSSAGVSEALG